MNLRSLLLHAGLRNDSIASNSDWLEVVGDDTGARVMLPPYRLRLPRHPAQTCQAHRP
jgi:hypothetical protein